MPLQTWRQNQDLASVQASEEGYDEIKLNANASDETRRDFIGVHAEMLGTDLVHEIGWDHESSRSQ